MAVAYMAVPCMVAPYMWCGAGGGAKNSAIARALLPPGAKIFAWHFPKAQKFCEIFSDFGKIMLDFFAKPCIK